MTFEELFLWAMNNQIGLQIYTQPIDYTRKQTEDNQIYRARFFGNNGADLVQQEILGIGPDELLRMCEFSLKKLYVNMTMKKPRKKKV